MDAFKTAREEHRDWLAKNALSEPGLPLHEDAYTGVLLATLLHPLAQHAVLRALSAGDPTAPVSAAPVTAVQWPSSGVDLVIHQGIGSRTTTTLVEHKRFDSPSHAPRYKSEVDAPWQTDQAYEATLLPQPPTWLSGYVSGRPVRLLVLDGFGKSMDTLFEMGEHNDKWSVTGYDAFGRSLRCSHDAGTPGLEPLVVALYAGPLPPVSRTRLR